MDSDKPVQNEKIIADNLSNSCITCFAEDANGYLWIGTDRGLNMYSGHEYSQYFHSSSEKSLLSNKITALFVSSDNSLWVGTSTGINSLQNDDSFKKYQISSMSKVIGEIFEYDGDIYTTTLGNVLKLNRETDTFEVVISVQNTPTIQCCTIDDLSIDVFYSNHIYRYSTGGEFVLEDILLEGTINDAYYDGDRFAYLSTTNGLVIYDNKRNVIEYTTELKADLETVSYYDDNCVIVSIDSRLYLFDNISHSMFPLETQSTSDYNISSCFVDSNGNLWIGFNNNGFQVQYKYDREFYTKNGIQRSGLSGKNVTSIENDSMGRIWFAVDHKRLFVYEDDELSEIDLQQIFGFHLTKQQSITNIFVDSDDIVYLCVNYAIVKCLYEKPRLKVIGSSSIWGRDLNMSIGSMNMTDYVISSTLLTESDDKSLWIGSVNGAFHHLSSWDSEIDTYPIENSSLTHMGDILTLSDGKILGGFYGRDLQVMDPVNNEICQTIPLASHISNYFYLTALCEDNEGGIWVGTRAEGVFHVSPDYSTVQKIEGIPCDDICAILCDAHGNIWISTYDGLSRYWSANGSITNYYKEDGIGGNQFNYRSAQKLSDGTLLFGGTHGVTVIDPNEEEHRSVVVPFHFDNLFVNNTLVVPYMTDIIDCGLIHSPIVRLNPDDRQISLSFSAIDFGNQNHIRYLYSLDNANDWTGVKNGAASFSKFPYGRHTLYAKIESQDNPHIDQIIDLEIIAKRPVLISTVAKVCYVLGTVAIILLFVFLLNRLYHTELEQQSQKLTNDMNMRFFANISHEFRTPLTMVNGAIKQLDGHEMNNGERRKLYGIINRNANRMISLVNQLMDFGKLDEDVLALNVRNVDALVLINKIVDEYRLTASLHNDMVKLRSGEDSIPMWMDEDKMEKILCNILSNAIKFTPSSNGVIAIDTDLIPKSEAANYFSLTDKDVDNQFLFVSVFNSGSFIPEDKLETVFERFAQLEQGAKVGGTGIGLYYTKKLVEIHHGHIKASNKRNDVDPERSGVVFTFILPVNDIAYSEKEKTSMPLLEKGFVLSNNVDKEVTKFTNMDKEKPLLLVIDDDAEVVYYLKNLLSTDFKVISAQNAEDGYKEMGQQNPDIVLCDILMPDIDGFELCRRVKSNLALCHIPFILLTAKYSIEDQIVGLNCGANAYVLKPFDPDYLLAIINSQLSNRDKLRDALAHNTESVNVEDTVKDELDKKFIAALYELMEQSISKPDMDVTEMARSLNVSRSQLYYKVKALTGETPHAFFNRYKLNIAAKWIIEDKCKISAIAQDLGFTSASHFTAIFKKEFGFLPSDYKDLYGSKK